MEIVVAVIMLITGGTDASNVTLKYETSEQMTVDQCLTQARSFNEDEDHPYIMVCMPLLDEQV